MLKKRIIPCLDIHEGRTVKGVQFVQLQDAGDPIAMGAKYAAEGADELVYLDISATIEGRNTFLHLVDQIAKEIDIPFTVGGGINQVGTVYDLLSAGADKITINSSAVKDPNLIDNIAKQFGSQCLVVAIDAKYIDSDWKVFTHGGRQLTEKSLYTWAKEVEDRGAGEILFTSMDHDGTKGGFAINALKKLQEVVSLPIIASGGAGKMSHFEDLFTQTPINAALAASIFHYNEIPIQNLKEYLQLKNIPIR